MNKTTWKLKAGATWRDKLTQEHANHGAIVPASESQRRRGVQTLLIPRPLDVDAAVRRIPEGKVATLEALREELGRAAGADTACPLTTGIFLRIVAEAAEEDRAAGKKRIAPYWRVVGSRGEMRDKIPGGVNEQAKRLRAEGIAVSPARGNRRPRVQELDDVLYRWTR